MVDVFKPVVPDYELILYCYTSIRHKVKPICNYVELKGMQVYIKAHDEIHFDEMLVPMLNYVIQSLEENNFDS